MSFRERRGRPVQPQPRPLGDVVDPLYNYTGFPPGRNDKGVMGPVANPVVLGPNATELTAEDERSRKDAQFFWDEYERRFLGDPPRDAQGFQVSSGQVTVATGTTAIVATYTVPDDYEGKLQKILISIPSAGSYPSVTWSLRINGSPYQGLNNYIADVDTNVLEDFVLELKSGQVLTLNATQSTGVGIIVVGALKGWVKYRGISTL